MREIFLFMMVTVDGYFEGVDHDISWHNANDEEFAAYEKKQSAETDAILMGHTTYRLMESFWPTEEATQTVAETSQFMTETQKYVVSRQPITTNWKHVTVLHQDPIQEITALKNQPGKNIAIFGSNMLAVSLMKHKLIDEFRIMVNPTAIGVGTPLFHGLTERVNFDLQDVSHYKSGNTMLIYTPKK